MTPTPEQLARTAATRIVEAHWDEDYDLEATECAVDCATDIIADAIREAAADARKVALEEACKAMCPHCDSDKEIIERPTGHWRHPVLESSAPCRAIPIRKLMEASE